LNALLLATTLLVAPGPQAAQDTITPTFEWPAGTVLSGEASIETVQSQNGQEVPGQSLQIALTRTISDHPQGLLVTSEVEGQAGNALPAFIVSDAGEFVGVEDVEQVVAQMREQLLASARAQTGGTVPPEAEAMAEQMFNAESIEAGAREEHRLLVGLWNGTTFEQNDVRTARMDLQEAVTQSVLSTEIEFVWRGFAPCAEGEAENSCIELEATLFPDENGLATAFEARLGAQSPGAIFVNRAVQTRTVRLLAQPDGLVPRLLVDRTEASFDIEAEGEIVELGLTQTEETRFSVGGGLN